MNIEKIIRDKQCTIIDVRTTEEFCGGNVAGSINIPLQDLNKRIEEIKILKQPLILCCASGGRSSAATQTLLQENIECYNGGSWLEVNYYQSQNNVKQ